MIPTAAPEPKRIAARQPEPRPGILAHAGPDTVHLEIRTHRHDHLRTENDHLVGKPPLLKKGTHAMPARRGTMAGQCTVPGLLTVAIVCLAMALTVRMSDVARIGAKWILDPLFDSTSDGGALFLLVGIAAMAICLALARRSHAAWLDRPDTGHVLLAIVVFAHTIGLLALFGYQERLELPWQLIGYHWSGGENTGNTLLHSHLGKTGLATLLQAFAASSGLPMFGGAGSLYDTGEVLLAHVPAMERWTIGLLFVAGLIAALAAAPGIARRHDWHPVAIALFAFAALDCLKTVIDGGALTCRLPASLLMLALLACARDTAHLRLLVRRHGLLAVGALVLHVGAWAAVARDGWDSAVPGVVTLAVIYGLALLCWAFRDQARAGVRLAALILGIGYLGLGYHDDAMSGIGMLLRPLPPQARIVVVDAQGRVARDASAAMRGATPLAVYRRFGEDPLKPRRVLIEAAPSTADIDAAQASAGIPAPQAADRPGREFAFALRFINGQPAAAAAPAGLYSLLAAVRVPDRTNTAVFLFRTASPLIPPFFAAPSTRLGRNNFYVHLHLVTAALRDQGLEEFVLMPLVDPADRDLFLPPRRGRGGLD
jgi:hypothetical protein